MLAVLDVVCWLKTAENSSYYYAIRFKCRYCLVIPNSFRIASSALPHKKFISEKKEIA